MNPNINEPDIHSTPEHLERLEELCSRITRGQGSVSLAYLNQAGQTKELKQDDLEFFELCRALVPRIIEDMKVMATYMSQMRKALEALTSKTGIRKCEALLAPVRMVEDYNTEETK